MQFRLKLIDKQRDIQYKIIDSFLEELNIAVNKAKPFIVNKIKQLVKNNIVNSQTYKSLTNGILKIDFGLINPSQSMNNIVDVWLREISVDFYSFVYTNSINGRLEINIIDESFGSVLSMPEAFYFSNGYKIDWLKWLLTSGSASIIYGYDVKYGYSPSSRTGGGIMVNKSGNSFNVNPLFSGIVKDNFVTRAMDNSEDKIADIIQEEIERVI